MLSVKGGTQTWSTAQQQVDHASEGKRTVSAADEQKYFGDQPVGDVLNKIADPNYVDPTKAVRKVGNSQLDKDSFMKLLLTQMKNQDPTNPMQSHEMAAQLAQFTSLEKLTNISDGVENLAKAQAPTQNFEALNLLGKAVSGDASRIDRAAEDDVHTITFNIQQDAPKAEINIKDAEGKTIRTLAAVNLKAGRNEVTWNGQTEEGRSASVGSYTVAIDATASNGAKLFADTKFEGVISGVNFTPQGPLLMIGKKTVALKDVKEIIDPNLANPGDKKTATATGSAPASNMENVGMSRAMVNQLNKLGVKAGL